MKLSTYAIIVTVLAMGFGLSFLLVPEKVAEFYGGSLNASGIVVTRYYGSANLLLGLIYWSYSSVSPAAKSWPKLLLYSLFYDILQLGITLMAILNKESNSMGWTSIGLFVLLAIASVYYMGQCSKARAQAS
jgi:hypothetical protein